uniref:Uncharacterized protein n=1 Tax=Candidatus Kentrum sp. TC TaxID=2126339 RepID=A0A450Z5T8_9GAMM|nr:MAG: hypothetical protein BECKTC1821D_GA0114238_10708 [Candidatus Kentron sp. TC]
METCAGSNRWYRIFTEMECIVCLTVSRLVKPFVQSNNKNDAPDAEAICLFPLPFSMIKPSCASGAGCHREDYRGGDGGGHHHGCCRESIIQLLLTAHIPRMNS